MRGKAAPRWSARQRERLSRAVFDLLAGEGSAAAADLRRIACEELGAPAQAEDASSPTDFAAFTGDPFAELAVVILSVAACLRAGGPTAELAHRVGDYANAAEVDPLWGKILRHMAAGHGRRVTMALARRAPDGKRVLAALRERHGLAAPWRIFQTMTGKTPAEPELGWWFKQLGLLPAGTLGRAFWRDMTRRKIMLPGEAGGLPEAAVHHDLVHTLGGFDTDPAGECEIAGFYAGTLCPGWPTWIFAALATFELGLRVGPNFTVPTRGAFDPARVWRAAKLGFNATFDPLGDWDYRPLMSMSLVDARARLGLLSVT